MLGLAAIGAYVYFAHYGTEPVYADGIPIPPPDPEPGSARPWEVEIPVSTYSTWHTRHGNTLTRIPLVSLYGRWPRLAILLYHNAASVDAQFDLGAGVGFNLGEGWTMSYSSQLLLDPPANPTTVTVIADDGAQTVFEWSVAEARWVPPAGVHDILTRDGNSWRVKHKDQSYHEYVRDALDGVTRLHKVVDAAGNELNLTYTFNASGNGWRLFQIKGGGRLMEFRYVDQTDRLDEIIDPRDEQWDPDLLDIHDRSWYFTYDGNNRIDAIMDPMSYEIEIAYYPSGRIEWITDKKHTVGTEPKYTYTYDTAGHLTRVLDPEPVPAGSHLQEDQLFDLTATDTGPIKGLYTDRRGNTRRYEYDILAFPDLDGDLSAFINPLDETVSYVFDAARNLERFYYTPGEEWVYTYDERGNVLSVTDPLQNTQYWEYDEYNNLTLYTDARGYSAEFQYEYASEFPRCSASSPSPGEFCMRCFGGDNDGEPCALERHCPGGGSCEPDNAQCGMCDGGEYFGEPCDDDGDCPDAHCLTGTCEPSSEPFYPTLLTRIIEPADGQGNPEAETLLDFYVDLDADRCGNPANVGCGRVKEVIDPNGVWTGFEYDIWGQKNRYSEGRLQGGGRAEDEYIYDELTTLDSGGRPEETAGPMSCATPWYGPNNFPYGLICSECGNPVRSEWRHAPGAPAIPAGPTLPVYEADWTVPDPENDYSPRGELLEAVVDARMVGGESEDYTRKFQFQYDELGRRYSATIKSTEWNGVDLGDEGRTFTYLHNTAAGQYTRTGPDGVRTFVQLDEAGRVDRYERGPEANPLMTADYDYYPNGLVERIEYSNDTSVNYVYDAALRLTSIDHQNILDNTILKLSYEYTDNGLISKITETDNLGVVGWVKFAYDARGRLIQEVRTGEHPYHIAYEYDQGGNRTRKVRSLPGCDRIETVYHYDVENPDYYGSFNNRLMYYETYETCRVFVEDYGHNDSCGTGAKDPVSTTWYYYNAAGNVVYVATEQVNPAPGEPTFSGTRLDYAKNGRTVTFVLGETWNDSGGQIVDYDITYAREFRYDAARERYYDRELNTGSLMTMDKRVTVSEMWSDYDMGTIYGNFTYDGVSTFDNVRSFAPGMASVDPWVAEDSDNTLYYHTNRAGTTRFMTDPVGTRIESSLYTAFGELVGGNQQRYGYAGAHGFEGPSSNDPADPYLSFPFLHVNPFYNAHTGRNLQRGSNGIGGAQNAGASAFPGPLGPPKEWGWPLPPGHDSNWKWVPNRDPDPKPPADPGHYEDPKDTKWRYHPEDEKHNPHWDYQPPGTKGWKKEPIDGLPAIKFERPPWWARWGQHIPAPAPQNVRKWQAGVAGAGAAAACGAIILGTGGAAAPFLIPAL
jgi:YD repeat-containing protein